MIASLFVEVVIYAMSLVYFSIVLGVIQICEYSDDDVKKKKYFSYIKIAVLFLIIGFNLGKGVFLPIPPKRYVSVK